MTPDFLIRMQMIREMADVGRVEELGCVMEHITLPPRLGGLLSLATASHE